jgi:hypothetical protein
LCKSIYINKGDQLTFEPADQVMSVRDAAFHTVHDYPGGAMALSTRLGVNGMTLSHQVNPNNSSRYSLSIEKAVEIQMFTQDFRMLHAMARSLGHVCVQIDEIEEQNVLASIADTVKEFSGYLTSVTQSVADSRVTDNEMRDIDNHLCTLVNQANSLRAVVAAMNQQMKPSLVNQGLSVRSKIRSVKKV